MTLPLAMLPWTERRFLKVTDDGLVPNAGGFVYFYETGSPETPLSTYKDQNSDDANTNPIELDADGRTPFPVFIQATGYRVVVTDSDDIELYSEEFVEDIGQTFLAQSAVIQSQGSTATSSPYTVATTDNTVLVNSADVTFVLQLPTCASRGTPLVIKNMSSVSTVRVTPSGAETIDGVASYYSLATSSTPNFPTITLNSDGVSNWIIASSHAIALS
ncbi:MAG TPA: hypothetical protein VHL34_24580 [Rhizomicrobium sp.]|jgi:hypothetical protein|nr:hypothetical protein [Rhizomicrobium sp.]